MKKVDWIWSHIFWLCCGCTFFGFTLAATLTDYESNLREWMGALSGWVAAAAAAVTVHYLRKSLAVSSKQTAIMSGELEPTFSYEVPIPNHAESCHRFKIINDGKYPIKVQRIELTKPANALFVFINPPREFGLKQKNRTEKPEFAVKSEKTNFGIEAGFGKEQRPHRSFMLAVYSANEPYFGEVELKAIYTLDGFGPNDRREMVCEETLIEHGD